MQQGVRRWTIKWKRWGIWTWRRHRFYLLVQFVAIYFFLRWVPYKHLPLPGFAVAAIAVLAAIMSVHPNMRPWQKFIWLLLIGAFLITELRAIRKDRLEIDQQALVDRQLQDLKFQGIRKSQDADFTLTADGLKEAISGIKETLQKTNDTFEQTRPYASVRFDDLHWLNTPGRIEANTNYGFNFFYSNGGTETATHLTSLAELYIADASSVSAQKEVSRRFEEAWRSKKSRIAIDSVTGQRTGEFSTVHRRFSPEEIKNLSPDGTIYFLVRFEYSDSAGRWRTDGCLSFQRESPAILDRNIAHPCVVFNRSRYSVKP
jgi:hypothetical protein